MKAIEKKKFLCPENEIIRQVSISLYFVLCLALLCEY